jgi:hypothetical protein
MTTPVPRSATHSNAYAADGRANNYGIAVAAGADPVNYSVGANPRGDGNNFYYPQDTWAPTLSRDDFDSTPDPHRVADLPRVDRRANLRDFWNWWAGLDRETAQRESVTEQHAAGWPELKGQRSRAPDPRWSPPPEPRPTSTLSPSRYSFMRPFQKDAAWLFDGSHMSLADNRRNFDILTMAPVPKRRNTYRAEPTPWDNDIVDMQDPQPWKPEERLESTDIPIITYRRPYRAD